MTRHRTTGIDVIAGLLLFGMGLSSCDSPTAPAAVASVTVTAPDSTLVVGVTMQATAVARDAEGRALADRAIEWSSSDAAIAAVSVTGLIAAVSPGSVTITARAEGRAGDLELTVLPVALAAPPGVRVERRSRLLARVSWEATDGAKEYRVEGRISGGEWNELGTTMALVFIDENPRSRGAQYDYRVTAIGDGRISLPSSMVSTTVPSIRLALIGDSNLARGKDGASTVATSYVEGGSLSIDPDGYPDHPKLLSGKIMALRSDLDAVNHGIAGTRTGTGTAWNQPNALHSIDGITRFEAEVLGAGYPWTAMSIPRVNAFAPTAVDFGYYSLGINDIAGGIAPETIRDNIGIAIDLWLAAGLPAAHLMVTTLGPRVGHENEANIPVTNQLIRELVSTKGVSLVDIAALVSDDDGLMWKDPGLQTGDGLHYTETTLDLIAAEVNGVLSSVQ
jgi:hypothetical protein